MILKMGRMTEPISSLYLEAVLRFQNLLEQAQQTDLPEPTAVSLATVSTTGRPEVRTVLLKSADTNGCVFYTNTHSRKGRALSAHPVASLCCFWQPLLTQVIIEGTVQLVAAEEADIYWRSRPRNSQLGAWASEQSEPLKSRAALEQRIEAYEKQFSGESVPRPPHWSGYRIKPDLIEFWRSKPGRLHERERYLCEAGVWRRFLLNP